MVTIVARDAEGAERVAAALRAQGEPALAAPVLVEAEGEPAPDLPPGVQVMVTSPRGARVLATALARHPAAGWRILALEGPTSRALDELGVHPDVTVAGGAAALAAKAGPGLLVHLTSNLGGDESASVRPDRVCWVGYRLERPRTLPAAVLAALEASPYALWVGSPSAVRNLHALAPRALSGAAVTWAHGQTTVEALTQLGVQAVPRTFPTGAGREQV